MTRRACLSALLLALLPSARADQDPTRVLLPGTRSEDARIGRVRTLNDRDFFLEVPANRKAWEVLSRWEKPFLTAFSDSDPVTRGADRLFRQVIPGAKDQPHTTIVGAGHFLQEDRGEEMAQVVVDFIDRTKNA